MKKICYLATGCATHKDQFRIIHANLESEYTLTQRVPDADVIIEFFCFQGDDSYTKIAQDVVYVNDAKKDGAIYIITGCAVAALGEEFFMQYANYVFGLNDYIEKIVNFLSEKAIKEKYYTSDSPHTISIDIVQGCVRKGGYCSFCKLNYMRTPVKSMPIDEVVETVKQLTTEETISCITLAGLNTCCYGIDIGDKKPKLHILIQKISQIPTVKDIYVVSLTAGDMYEELIDELATNPKVFAISLGYQSGSNTMLKTMNVHSTVEQIQYLHNRLSHKPNDNIMVVCHPGETMETIQETIAFIKKNNLWNIHIQPFSDFIGIPSHEMEQLSNDDYNLFYKLVKNTVLELTNEFIEKVTGTYIDAHLRCFVYYTSSKELEIYAEPSSFHGALIMTLKNVDFEEPKIKAFIEKSYYGCALKCRVTGVFDTNNFNPAKLALSVDDMEVI